MDNSVRTTRVKPWSVKHISQRQAVRYGMEVSCL